MDWDKLFKKYLWDEEKTPYLTPVPRLTRTQADYEVLFYSIFLGILFAVVAVAASTHAGPGGRSVGIAYYALSVVCCTVVFAFSKHYWAALYCAATPVAGMAWLFLYRPDISGIDFVTILVLLLLWLRYSWRVASIGRHYPGLSGSMRDSS